MTEFSVSRIVPSTRDLFGAIATRRKSLALIADLSSSVESDVLQSVHRLDALDVRAFCRAGSDTISQRIAQGSKSIPLLQTEPVRQDEDAHRARFFGADGVIMEAGQGADWANRAKTPRSMRMAVLGLARTPRDVETLLEQGARGLFLLPADPAEWTELAECASSASLVVAASVVDLANLRALLGKVDAAIVGPSIHAGGGFEDLLDELDG